MSSAGPNFPTVATGTGNTIGGGTRAWANPQNIEANDGLNATVAFTSPIGVTTDDLIGTGFGFSIPSTATITGILLEIRYVDISSLGVATESIIKLLKAGSVAGSNKSTGASIPSVAATVSYGGSNDLWGTTWSFSDINNANFGAVFVATDVTATPDTIGVDFFRITVFFTNTFNDVLSLSNTAGFSETPANKISQSFSTSATAGISEFPSLVISSTLSLSNTASFSESVADIPGAPNIGFSLTAATVISGVMITGVQGLAFPVTSSFGESGIIGAQRGMSFPSSAMAFFNATVGGQALLTYDAYTSLVTSEHNKRPNFMAMVALCVQGYVDAINLLRSFSKIFDIDQAIGQQLDMIGVWVGITRNIPIPLTGVYFALDTTGVGFNQGAWFGIGDSISGLTTLGDDDYRLLLKGKIASNHWDGTIPGAYDIWAIVFAGQNFTILIQDGQDMTMAIIIIGTNITAVALALLTNGFIALRPAGVLISGYYQNSVPSTPAFGFGIENSVIAGFDHGSWVKKIG